MPAAAACTLMVAALVCTVHCAVIAALVCTAATISGCAVPAPATLAVRRGTVRPTPVAASALVDNQVLLQQHAGHNRP